MRLLPIVIVPMFATLMFAQERTRTETQTTIITERNSADLVFDVRYHDDRGKLVVGEKSVSFEDVSEAKHSRSWSYAQIKEFKRQGGNELKIEPYSGDSIEFHVEGSGLSDAVYNTIADRIVAARSR